MSDRGFYALNVVDSPQKPLFLYAVSLTLAQTFPQVEVWVDLDQAAGGERLTYLVIASKHASGVDQLHSHRLDGPRWQLWDPNDLARRIVVSGVPILTDDFAPVDRLMSHVAQD